MRSADGQANGRRRIGVGGDKQVEQLKRDWQGSRWRDISRPYTAEEVVRLRGSIHVEHTVARRGAERLHELLTNTGYVAAL